MKPIGLYLHIPFCDGKCNYCAFFSRTAAREQMSYYTEQLIKSISDWGKRIDRPADTVYFGGGTPSLLGHDRLIAVLNSIYNSFAVTDNAEITVEVNPTSAASLDFSAMRNAGFNRLSIGMQSVNDNELSVLGRRHDSSAVKSTVEQAKSGGFDNISLDVMLAIPEQTVDSLDRTLEFCASQNVSHISCYILKIEEGTRFYKIKDTLPLFDDDGQAALYEHTVQHLAQLDYRQYEISNFSHDGCESRHNLHYWRDEEYLGIGPSAHSFIDGERFYYPDDFQSFYDGKTEYEGVGGSGEEYIMLALRLNEGLRFCDYRARFGTDISDDIIKAAEHLQKNGLCVVDETGIRLTVKGFLVSNSVISYLLN